MPGHRGHCGERCCWAQPLAPPYHPWIDWVNKREAERKAKEKITKDGPKGPEVSTGDLINNNVPLDAINPTISPLDLIGGGAISKTARTATKTELRALMNKLRDTSWITNAPRSQLQSKFMHAKDFGIKGNWNNQNLAAFIKALEKHIKSPDTLVIKGTYHKKPVTHYYNPKTQINVMRNTKGDFISGWRLKPKQQFHIMKDGKLGGN